MKAKTIVIFLMIVMGAGCAGKKSVIVLAPNEQGQVGALELSNQKGSMTLDEPGKALMVKNDKSLPSAVKPIGEGEIEAVFGQAMALQPDAPVSYLLYFEFGAPELTPDSSAVFRQVIDVIKKRDSKDIVVIGHTDRAGSDQYNNTLSLERAHLIRDRIIAAGIANESIETVTHGENNPLIQTADGVAEPKNRRVEVIIR